ncbi:MAG: 50S ribosomal protein L25/general stress protein Ctc [Bacteroidota bacterium]|nr:50S ribosomal protein L25/general stress protein Ctc [Bacteroidota bacterium]
MKTLAINAKLRKSVGKAESKALRNQGNVPCVLYGGEKQVCFYAHENDFRNLVYTSDVFIVDLDIDGGPHQAIVQDLQFHPVTDKLIHIDFLEIFPDKEVTVSIPVVLQGISIGVRNGGVLLFRRRKIITRAIPSKLPDIINIDINALNIGDFIYIKDLRHEEYNFLAPDNAVVVGVKTARNIIEEVEEEVEEELEEGSDSEENQDGEKPKEESKEGDVKKGPDSEDTSSK